jgi:hypothetical protein
MFECVFGENQVNRKDDKNDTEKPKLEKPPLCHGYL